MTEFDRHRVWGGALLIAALVLALSASVGLAQTDPQNAPQVDDNDQQDVAQTTPPPPPPKAKPRHDPGPFAKGKVRVGFFGGAGNTWGQTYLILGGGIGYFLMDGFEVGFDAEGWLLESPNFWKLTPQVRYVVWQMNPVRPYVGAFWRKTIVTGGFEDYNSWGGRAGIAYRKGGNYLAVGVVYEKFTDYIGSGDDYVIYPEIAFWISF